MNKKLRKGKSEPVCIKTHMFIRSKPMTTEIAKKDESSILTKIIMENDLSKLSSGDRLFYVQKLCEETGLSAWLQPFQFIAFQNGKVSLYATKNCTDQLRDQRNVSIDDLDTKLVDGYCIVTAKASMPDAYHPDGKRRDEDVGGVPMVDRYGNELTGENKMNALMKAVTKAKRRVTLSICQLGGLLMDETEAESIGGASFMDMDYDTGELEPTGRVIEHEPRQETSQKPQTSKFWCEKHKAEWFKRGKMRSHAHPVEGSNSWCNMKEDRPASSRAPAVKKAMTEKDFIDKVTAEGWGRDEVKEALDTTLEEWIKDSGATYEKAWDYVKNYHAPQNLEQAGLI
tara:strand:+ start:1864 stop:2889 length:1026 start_codon:yes stop_codon:yes gene_type:complete